MTKIITCIGCSKFCRNNDAEALAKKIQEVKAEGHTEVIFLCEFLKNFFANSKSQELATIKIGWKNNKGKITYF